MLRGMTSDVSIRLEGRVAAWLEKADIPFNYEARKVNYTGLSYTPDLFLKNGVSRAKGLETSDRQDQGRVRTAPEMDLRRSSCEITLLLLNPKPHTGLVRKAQHPGLCFPAHTRRLVEMTTKNDSTENVFYELDACL